MNGLVVLFRQVFDNGAAAWLLQLTGQTTRSARLRRHSSLLNAVFHVTVMILKDTAAVFDQLPIKRFHSGDAPTIKMRFCKDQRTDKWRHNGS
jgi:hypothetical protein